MLGVLIVIGASALLACAGASALSFTSAARDYMLVKPGQGRE